MPAISASALLATLIAVSVVDIRRRIIPNRLLLAAVAFWFAIAVWSGGDGAVAGLLAALVLSLPLLIATLIRPEGMGMGDAKLVAVIGLFLGWGAWPALLAGLFLAGLTGVLISLGTRQPPAETSLPLAPFLAAGVVISLIPLQ